MRHSSRRIIDTMVVAVGSVLPSDVFVLSASTTPNGRIALIVERDEIIEDAIGNEVWTDEQVEAFVGQSDEDLDSELEARGLIYESADPDDMVDGKFVDLDAAAQG